MLLNLGRIAAPPPLLFTSKSLDDLGLETSYEDALAQHPRVIRDAFKSRVRECHPDKHPGDPTAPVRFSKLKAAAEALQVPCNASGRPLEGSQKDLRDKRARLKLSPSSVAGGSAEVQPHPDPPQRALPGIALLQNNFMTLKS